jgi:hypothetical protein
LIKTEEENKLDKGRELLECEKHKKGVDVRSISLKQWNYTQLNGLTARLKKKATKKKRIFTNEAALKKH